MRKTLLDWIVVRLFVWISLICVIKPSSSSCTDCANITETYTNTNTIVSTNNEHINSNNNNENGRIFEINPDNWNTATYFSFVIILLILISLFVICLAFIHNMRNQTYDDVKYSSIIVRHFNPEEKSVCEKWLELP